MSTIKSKELICFCMTLLLSFSFNILKAAEHSSHSNSSDSEWAPPLSEGMPKSKIKRKYTNNSHLSTEEKKLQRKLKNIESAKKCRAKAKDLLDSLQAIINDPLNKFFIELPEEQKALLLSKRHLIDQSVQTDSITLSELIIEELDQLIH